MFLAHLVGTASILAHDVAPKPVVFAGLLHAAYLQVEFGNGKPGVNPARRKLMLQAVSPEVNELLEGYAKMRWKPDTLAKIAPVAADLPADQKTLLWMRIANATRDDGTCTFPAGSGDGGCMWDGNNYINSNDLLLFLGQYDTPCD